MQLDDVTLALEDALAHVVAAERKQWTRERERIEIEARATISDLRAEVAHLKTANEMLRIDLAKRVDDEVLRVREAMALVKDGRDGEVGPQGDPGKDADPEEVAALVLARIPAPEKGERGEPGRDGKDVDQSAIEARAMTRLQEIASELNKSVADLGTEIRAASDAVVNDLRERLATLKDGAPGEKGDAGEKGDEGRGIINLTIDEESGDLWARYSDDTIARIGPARGLPGEKGEAGERGEKGDAGPQGERGEKGDQGRSIEYVELIDGFLAVKWEGEQDAQGLGMIRGPAGEKGDPGLPGEKGDRGDPGADGRDGRDGVGLAGAFRAHDGNLVLTLTDGTVRELGNIDGKDGAAGATGRDGKDGLSFDAFSLEPEYDGERTLRLCWSDAKGNEQVREWRLPIMLYREIWKAGVQYEAGDTVRYGGSLWLATADTSEKPGDGCKDWRLVARAGRDGRDGQKGEKGEKGDPGRPGKDLTFLKGDS